MSQGPSVAVVGAGVVGLATGLALRDRGAQVSVYERGEPGHAAEDLGARVGTQSGQRAPDVTGDPLAQPGRRRRVLVMQQAVGTGEPDRVGVALGQRRPVDLLAVLARAVLQAGETRDGRAGQRKRAAQVQRELERDVQPRLAGQPRRVGPRTQDDGVVAGRAATRGEQLDAAAVEHPQPEDLLASQAARQLPGQPGDRAPCAQWSATLIEHGR